MQAARTEPQKTRAALLFVAQNLMREKGFSATRVEEICQAAGVTKGAFFHHFRSKDDLGKEALRDFMAGHARAMEGAWTSESDPVRRLLAYLEQLEAAVTTVDAHRSCLLAVFTQELSFVDEGVWEMVQGSFDEWLAVVENLIADAAATLPEKRRPRRERLALLVVSTVEGALLIAKARRDPSVVGAAFAELRDQLARVFAAA